MENNNFDQFFADKLQSDLEFDFQESSWQKVANQLDEPVAASNTWKKWVVPIVWMALVGTIGYLLYKLDKTNDSLEELHQKVIAQGEKDQKDTLVVERLVVQRDTIYLSNSLRNNTHDISVNGTAGLGTSTFSPFFYFSSLDDQWLKDSEKLITSNQDLWKFIQQKNKENLKGNESNTSLADLNRNLQQLPYSSSYISFISKNLEAKELDINDLNLKPKAKLKYYFIPQGFKLGFSTGRSFIPSGSLSDISSHNYGIKGEIQFPRNVSLNIGYDWYNLSYRTTDLSLLNGDIPMPDASMHEEHSLADLVFMRTKQSFQQVKIGFKHQFPTQNRVQPYMGLNLLSSLNFKKEFSYFFDNAQILADEFELNLTNTNPNFKTDGFGLDIGVEIQPKDWLSIQFEGYYHFINRNAATQYYDLVGLRTSVLYRFGN